VLQGKLLVRADMEELSEGCHSPMSSSACAWRLHGVKLNSGCTYVAFDGANQNAGAGFFGLSCFSIPQFHFTPTIPNTRFLDPAPLWHPSP